MVLGHRNVDGLSPDFLYDFDFLLRRAQLEKEKLAREDAEKQRREMEEKVRKFEEEAKAAQEGEKKVGFLIQLNCTTLRFCFSSFGKVGGDVSSFGRASATGGRGSKTIGRRACQG